MSANTVCIHACGWGLPWWLSWYLSIAAKAGDERNVGLISGLGKSPGEGNGNLLQYSCLGNAMDRGAWWARVHGVTKVLDRTKWLNKNHNDVSVQYLGHIYTKKVLVVIYLKFRFHWASSILSGNPRVCWGRQCQKIAVMTWHMVSLTNRWTLIDQM